MTTSTAEKNPTETPPSGEYPAQPLITQEEPRLTQGTWIGMIIVAAIVAGVVIFGVMARRGSEHSLAKETAASAIPSVNVVYPINGANYSVTTPSVAGTISAAEVTASLSASSPPGVPPAVFNVAWDFDGVAVGGGS